MSPDNFLSWIRTKWEVLLYPTNESVSHSKNRNLCNQTENMKMELTRILEKHKQRDRFWERRRVAARTGQRPRSYHCWMCKTLAYVWEIEPTSYTISAFLQVYTNSNLVRDCWNGSSLSLSLRMCMYKFRTTENGGAERKKRRVALVDEDGTEREQG